MVQNKQNRNLIMTTLLETLLAIRPKHNDFTRPELIQGYNETEIQEIEQRYNLSVQGQFREFLMTMGKCSGGVLLGQNLTIFNPNYQPTSQSFGIENQQYWYEHEDLFNFFQKENINPIQEQLLYLDNRNEHISFYFLFTNRNENIVYEYDSNLDEIKLNEYGTLFDYLIWCRKDMIAQSKRWMQIFNANPNRFKELTTGRLL